MRRIGQTLFAWLLLHGSSVFAQGDPIANAVRADLLDPQTPIETRKASFDEIEAIALRDKHPTVLYVVGSLYSQGNENEVAPVTRDPDRAREFLSRAALNGSVAAMAKLSALELQAKNRFEANVWAQLHHHYGKQQVRFDRNYSESFAASLIGAAQSGFPESEREALNQSVGSMIATYDAAILRGQQQMAVENAKSGLNVTRGEECKLTDLQQARVSMATRLLPIAMAEYFLEFGEDGRVRRTWMLDSWPDRKFARGARACAMALRVDPATMGKDGARIALLPLSFSSNRHRLRAGE